MRQKKLFIATGGTGGHIFPAIALAEKLQKESPQIKVTFIGRGLSKNRFFNQSHYPFKEIRAAAIPLKKPFLALKGVITNLRGLLESRRLLKQEQPDMIVGFGSCYTLPLLLAACEQNVPFVLHEQNIIPGKVNRLFSRFARITAINFDQTHQYLKGATKRVSMPSQHDFTNVSFSQEEARASFGLNPKMKTLLIFGGSQGAVAVNQLMIQVLTMMSQTFTEFQIIHLIGAVDDLEQLEKSYKKLSVRYYISRFEANMTRAYRAADITVARAGASTVSEHLSMQVPAIFIPYPYAHQHQTANAQFFSDHVQGGLTFLQHLLKPEKLADVLLDLLHYSPGRLEEFRKKISTFKDRENTLEFHHMITELLGERDAS